MKELEEARSKLQKIKSEQRKERWDKKVNWIQKHKQQLVFATIFIMLSFIIFNQVTYVNTEQRFYIGEVKDMGIRWEGGSTKTAVVWISFNDSTEIDFRKYSYNSYEMIESDSDRYIGNNILVTYEKGFMENTLLFIMLL